MTYHFHAPTMPRTADPSTLSPVVPDNKQGPKHGSLGKPVQGPEPWRVYLVGQHSHARDDGKVQTQVRQRLGRTLAEAVLGDGVADVGQREGRRVGQGPAIL